jgi:hypothetical protein
MGACEYVRVHYGNVGTMCVGFGCTTGKKHSSSQLGRRHKAYWLACNHK